MYTVFLDCELIGLCIFVFVKVLQFSIILEAIKVHYSKNKE